MTPSQKKRALRALERHLGLRHAAPQTLVGTGDATDVFSWRLLRREYGLSEAATYQTMLMSVRALLRAFAEGEKRS